MSRLRWSAGAGLGRTRQGRAELGSGGQRRPGVPCQPCQQSVPPAAMDNCVCVCRPGMSLPACLGLHLQLSAVRRGNIPLAMADHLLVLNWNRQAPLLLRQLATNGHGDSKSLGR